ncbi:MAG: hypothetical protein R3349_03885, partial [Geminicoccaceae bacterium]|nr:hypothetical protein [Geminicoccaceae bacterium]
MREIGKAMFDILSQDATIAGLVGTYEGAPAVFDMDSAPDGYGQDQDQVPPYVVMPGAISHDREADLDGGAEAAMQVLVYGPSPAQVEPLAERVAELLEEQ